jgi:hypothetical protein
MAVRTVMRARPVRTVLTVPVRTVLTVKVISENWGIT